MAREELVGTKCQTNKKYHNRLVGFSSLWLEKSSKEILKFWKERQKIENRITFLITWQICLKYDSTLLEKLLEKSIGRTFIFL